jgi:thioredoxin
MPLGLNADVGVMYIGSEAATSQIEEALFPQIEAAFGEYGVEIQTHRDDPGLQRIRGTGPVELAVTVSVTVLLVPFFKAVVAKAGDDAYAALKKLVSRTVTVEEKDVPAEAGSRGRSEVVFRDADAPVGVLLHVDLPDVAFGRLAGIDWAQLVQIKPTWQQNVTLRWDPEDEAWWIARFNRPAPMAGEVTELNEGNFQTVVIEAERPIFVHFWATWATPCQVMASQLAQLAREREDVGFASLNIDENSALAALYPIMAVPTLGLFRHGELVHPIVGAHSKTELVQKIGSALAT